MLNRNIPPQIVLPAKIDVPKAEVSSLSNGTPLFVVNSGSDPVCRLDVILDSGSRYQRQSLEATATISMLSEGTSKHTSQQIAEHFDFHGSFIDLSADRDWGKITLYSLRKYFKQSLEMLSEMVKTPSFPHNELEIWSSRSKQSLMVELEKTSTLARQVFYNSMFGENHPYGRFAKPDDYDLLNSEMLKKFHANFFGASNSKIILSGHIETTEIKLVEQFFGSAQWGTESTPKMNDISRTYPKYGFSFAEKQGAVQSAIRMGCELFTRNHPDYPKMLVLNTILGGFFGSRLMKNLREEKGYTYGISSNLITLRDSGFLVISSEVGSQFAKSAIEEIHKEIQRIKNEPVEHDELQQVKSYMWGEALRSFNGPFAIADNTISLLNYNQLDYSFYDRMFSTLSTINPDEIVEVANKWLVNERFVVSVSGNENPSI